MSCHDCVYSTEDDCNPNNFVCLCTELFKGKPNEHYLHILHANHTCMQFSLTPPKPSDDMVDDEMCELALDRKEDITHEEAAKKGYCTNACKYKNECLGFPLEPQENK